MLKHQENVLSWASISVATEEPKRSCLGPKRRGGTSRGMSWLLSCVVDLLLQNPTDKSQPWDTVGSTPRLDYLFLIRGIMWTSSCSEMHWVCRTKVSLALDELNGWGLVNHYDWNNYFWRWMVCIVWHLHFKLAFFRLCDIFMLCKVCSSEGCVFVCVHTFCVYCLLLSYKHFWEGVLHKHIKKHLWF